MKTSKTSYKTGLPTKVAPEATVRGRELTRKVEELCEARDAMTPEEIRDAEEAILVLGWRFATEMARWHLFAMRGPSEARLKEQRWDFSLDDAIDGALYGMLRAMRKFDPSLGVQFTTFARWEMVAGMQRMASNWSHRGMSTSRLRTILSDESAGRPVSAAAKEAIRAAATTSNSTFDRDWAAGNASPSATGPTAHEALEIAEREELLGELLRTLKPREAEVLRLRNGIGGGDPQTLLEIAKRFGITRERIRQIEANGLDKLKETAARRRLAEVY